MADQTSGNVLDGAQAEKELFPAKGLSGGGQLEVRMEISANHPDPDIRIECPLLVGYNRDDRVMDPRGALNLYENPVNSPDRSMVDGVCHGEKRFDRRTFIADWFMKQLKAGRNWATNCAG